MLKIEYIPLDDLTPYENNAREHRTEDVKQIAQSIDAYGFDDPVGVWGPDNVIVEGHGRALAAKRLGLEKVPCIRLDHLTDQQRREYAIAHNRTAELSRWDKEKLKLEVPDLDLSGFDFGLDFMAGDEYEEQHEKNCDEAQFKRENILQLAHGQYDGDNPYDIPELEPVYDLPPIEEWIDFDEVLREKHPEKKAVHFFCDDYKFERIWNNPEKYVEKLKKFVCIATPDFSPYGDMPLICQMFNHYRKHWVGAWMQDHGVTVIPTIRCSTDPRSLDWYLDGEPHGGIVIMSSMWTGEESEINLQEYARMKETLNPCKIFIYGKPGNMGVSADDPVEYIQRAAFKRERNKNG